MPEGDTIFRTATVLRSWLTGRQVSAIESPSSRVVASERTRMESLIGCVVGEVEARGKNLLMRFDREPSVGHAVPLANSLVLHTHMRMTGSWHVYSGDSVWLRPRNQARLVIHCDERLAVCFNVPVLSLEPIKDLTRNRSLRGLGPDVLVEPLDLESILNRVTQHNDRPIGDVLLDQSVVCGIGNIYRCESLFIERLNPSTTMSHVDRSSFSNVVATAARLMRANLGPSGSRDLGIGHGVSNVYGRAGLPCRRCGESVETGRLGTQARIVFWCPGCQPTV